MNQVVAGIDFAPVLPLWLMAVLGGLALLALLVAMIRPAPEGGLRFAPARGVLLRAATFAVLLLALATGSRRSAA